MQTGPVLHSKQSILHCQILPPKSPKILPLRNKRPASVAKMQRGGTRPASRSIKPRNHACRPAHIGSILVAECADHHCFFPRYAAEKQRTEADETGWPRNPVWQKQSLCERHQPKAGIHRVPHHGVDAGCDERMAFAQVEADGPILAEVTMASVKQP